MATTLLAQSSANLLLNYITQEIKVLEPQLLFTKFGVQKDIPKGWNQLAFPQWNQVATSSVSTISEGVNPATTTLGNTAYVVGVTQYGLLAQVSDILVRNSAVEVIDSAIEVVRNALVRQIDNSIQTTVQGGTNGHIYAGGKTARASLALGDTFTITEYTKAVRNLRQVNSAGLEPFDGGYYVCIAHPNTLYDLMQNTGVGSFLDIAKYSDPASLKSGHIGGFRGARVMETANSQTTSSTTTVFHNIFLGKNSFGWGYFQPVTPQLVTTADSNNGLFLYTSIGAKVGIGSVRFEDASNNYRIVDVETGAST